MAQELTKIAPISMHQNTSLMTCGNCGHEDMGTYCSMCGTKLSTDRLSVAVLAASIVDFFYNVENKYVATFKALYCHPIRFIETYINGQRDAYYIPFKYFFFNLSMNVLVMSYFNIGMINDLSDESEDAIFVGIEESAQLYDSIINNYGSFFSLLIIPIFVLLSKALFPNVKYNLAEKASAITYLFGQLMIYRVGFNLITAVFPSFYDINTALVFLMEYGLIFLLSYRFYKERMISALWKSAIIFTLVFFTLKYTLVLLNAILELLYN
jgi:Protein of unknown function (DUF3667)